MDILDALTTALKNGNEGWFAASGREEDGETGFWIRYEDYERLKSAIEKSLRPAVG